MSTSLQVWDCTKCGAIRASKCSTVCLPGDNITRTHLRPLATHPNSTVLQEQLRNEWIDYAVSRGIDQALAESMTLDELIAMFGGDQ